MYQTTGELSSAPQSRRIRVTTAEQDVAILGAILGAIQAQPMLDATIIWCEIGKQNVVVIIFWNCLYNGSENYFI